MNNLYFYTWNNYYNRQYKGKPTAKDLELYKVGSIAQANFNPNDGVNTEQIIQTLDWQNFDGVPDYMMVCEPSYLNDEGKLVPGEVISRWFVVEATRERSGQYTALLRRDLVADFYEDIINAPAFIEKATLNTMDPLIWNSEQMTYNQIKKAEIEIRDKTQTPWIVGYYALKQTEEDQTSGPVSVGVAEYVIDKEINDITKYNYYEYTQKPYYYLTKAELQVNAWRWINASKNKAQYSLFPQADTPYFIEDVIDSKAEGKGGQALGGNGGQECLDYLVKHSKDYDLEQEFIDTVLTIDGINQETLATLQQEQYKVLKDTSTNKIYKVNLRIGPVNEWSKPRADIARDPNYETVYDNTELAIGENDIHGEIDFDASENSEFYQYNISQQQILFSLDEITPTSGHYINIDEQRRTLNDAPYSMFCIPYGEINIIHPTGDETTATFTTNKANALTIGSGLMANKPGFVYDVQILPFCPIEKIRRVFSNNSIDMRQFRDRIDYTTSAYAIKQVIFWADSSQGSIDILAEHLASPDIRIEQVQELLNTWSYNYSSWDPIEAKVVSETSMYRLCSPNYASMFEYNLAKNAGINGSNMDDDPVVFHVDYGYKPYTPYVRVAPIFGGLYGSNYNDARGLILSGDFSITAITDRWEEYQLQNKNYQLAFDRQIENMEVQNKYARLSERANYAGNIVSAGVSGGVAGYNFSGGNSKVGMLSAGVNMATSAVVGGIDLHVNQQLRNEAMDYTKDNFGFALGNIQALPHTLNKVSAINPNFRYFPILEIYDATDEEKNALRQKITYNGMTVGRINTISAYLREDPTYIKAQIIRMESIPDDTHVLNEIANEINKGVYIK